MVFAWDDSYTHPNLTKSAIEKLRGVGWLEPYFQNTLGFKKNVGEVLKNGSENKSIIDLLLEGSKEEDSPIWRAKNHFHSPIINSGLHQPLNNGESALAWERGDSGKNEYSWAKARQYYAEALFTKDSATRNAKMALTFASLGQVMHLIQDMAVPAHTRNDMQGAGQVSAA